jgi:hypothetical protein
MIVKPCEPDNETHNENRAMGINASCKALY